MGRLRKVSRSSTSLSSGSEEQGSDSDTGFEKKGKGRSRGLMKGFQESADGKLDVLIHPTKLVAVGPGRKDFIADLSLMVHRDARHNVSKWKQVPQSVKDKIVQNALENWRLPNTYLVRRAILEEANRLYRNWRNRLHHHYLAFETKEEALEHVPDDICDSDWHFLVDHFSSPAFERMSQINKANRAKLRINHTSGQKSFQAISYELRDPATGKEPDMQKLWELTHKRANGEWVDEASKEINDKVAEKINEEQCRLQDSGDAVTTNEKEIINAAFSSITQKKSSFMLCCEPLGSSSYIINQNLQTDLEVEKRKAEEARRECNQLRAELAEVQSQLAEEQRKRQEIEGRLSDRNKEMQEINNQIQASIQDALSQHRLSISEGESSESARMIAELEAQLHEAEDVITDLRAELRTEPGLRMEYLGCSLFKKVHPIFLIKIYFVRW